MVLGEQRGWLEVFDIETSIITHSHKFTDAGDLGIHDIIAIDNTQYLLAAVEGLLKTTKDQLINHYYKWKTVRSLCHITDSIYFVGLDRKMIVWNQQKE